MKFIVRKIRKGRMRISYLKYSKSKKRFGRMSDLPSEWIGKKCLVIPLKPSETSEIYGKMRALDLIDSILLKKK